MNAIIYARYSPRPNGPCESIEMQVERCEAYCKAQGYTLVRQFDDRELSGARADNRPGLQSALEMACQQKAVVVCYSLSRLARNTRDALAILDRLQKCGGNVALLDMNIDTVTPMGRCVFTILSAVAELEREQIAKRTSDALQRYQANGKLVSRHPPYGYRVCGRGRDRLEKDEGEQAIMAEIAAQHAAGASLREICGVLEDKGLKARTGGWNTVKIRQILDRIAS